MSKKRVRRPELEAPSESDGEVDREIDADKDDRDNKVKKSGGSFQGMGLIPALLKAIQRKGFRLPTPIQRKCIPPLLGGRDVVGMARTGSGKTAAFVLPLLQTLRSHSVKVGIRGLILSPSRELALQTYSVVKALSKETDLRSIVLVGGESVEEQFAQLATNPDIVVATPGRLMHLCVETRLSLKEVQFVVWDEADRLMEDPTMGQQMKELNARFPETRLTALFSATLPKALADFANTGLQNPLLVRLDAESKLSPDLKMAFLQAHSDTKDALLLLLLGKILTDRTQLTVIFVATKHHVEYLQELLNAYNLPCTYIYGALDQTARKLAIEQFRKGKKTILVVTDVAARGIDIPLLDNVINYDFPPSSKLFLHRVGRVARAGRSGRAFSLVSPDELSYLFDLQLFLGKAVVSCVEEQEYDKSIPLGVAPQGLLDVEEESLLQQLSVSGTLESLKGVMKNAYKLYRKTRPSPSPESHRRSKDFTDANPILGVHPIFTSVMDKNDLQQTNIMSALQQYRPKASHLKLPSVRGPSKKKRSTEGESEHTTSIGGKSLVMKKSSSTTRDESHYLRYVKDDSKDDAGYSLTGKSFAEQSRKAVFDLSTADDPTVRGKRHSNDPRKKLVATEFGTKVPASFRTDLYDKWRAKTHLDIQQPGEVESNATSGRANSILTGNAERKRWRNKRLKRK